MVAGWVRAVMGRTDGFATFTLAAGLGHLVCSWGA